MRSAKDSESTYSSIISLNTNEDDASVDELPENADTVTDDHEENPTCEINLHADHYRLCQAKTAHGAFLGKIDGSLVKKTLLATEAPHLDTIALIAKLDAVAKTIDLYVSAILDEQKKDPAIGTVRSWLHRGTQPEANSPEIEQSKGLL